MYDLYDEVTPFEVEDSDDEAEDYLGPEDPDAVSVLIRRDYTVKDREVLIDHARRADPELSDLSEDAQPSTVDSTATALAVVFDVYDPDEIAQRAPELGLEPGDATLWVTAAPATESGEWLESPFDDADPGTVIYRFETSVAYEDELVELERELS
jgi:hypothetical protein